MHCLYCNAENPDTTMLCLSCGHALPTAKVHKTAPATPPNYAFPFQARPENARIVGKREFRVKAGMPPPLPAHPAHHLGSGARGLSTAAGPRPLAADTAEVLAAPAAEATPAVATVPQNTPEPGPAMRPKLEPELRPAAAPNLDSGPEPLHPAHAMSPNHANAGFGPGRQTPYFDEAAFGAGDASKYIPPSVPPSPPWHEYDIAPPSPGKLARAALLLCIFALGAGSGAAALWWTANPDTLQQTLAAKLAGSAAPVPASAPADAPDAAKLDTPAGELPYDGLAASATPTPNSTPASAIAPVTTAAPEAGADSAASAAALAAAPAQPQPAQEPGPNPKNTVTANTASNTPPMPDSANAADLISAAEPIAASRVTPAPPAAETPTATLPAPAKTGKKRPPAQSASSAKADDGETPAGIRSARTARASSNFSSGSSADAGSSGQRSLTPLMIAQCESMSDRSERILCKQEVCNGKWGSNGCPASPHGGSGPR